MKGDHHPVEAAVECTCDTDGWCNLCRDSHSMDEYEQGVFDRFLADLEARPLVVPPPDDGERLSLG